MTAFLMTSMPAIALTESEELSLCKSIDDDSRRLLCYDIMVGIGERAKSQTTTSNWHVTSEQSPLDDSKNVTATVESNENIQCSWNRESHKVSLILRCKENTTAVILHTDCHMTTHNSTYGTVDYRVDKNTPRKQKMAESTDSRSLGLWRGETAIPFIKRNVVERDTLLIRATPFSDNPFTVTFDIRGAKEALKPLRDACNW